eukprot:scaffold286696_cov14-Tisochrysis_lutea.AAC.1
MKPQTGPADLTVVRAFGHAPVCTAPRPYQAQLQEEAAVCEWLPVVDVHLQRPYLPSNPSAKAPSAPGLPDPHTTKHQQLSARGLPRPQSINWLQQQQQLTRSGAGVNKDGFEPGGWDVDASHAGSTSHFRDTDGRYYGDEPASCSYADEHEEQEEEEEGWVVEVDLRRLRGGRGAGGKKGRPRAYAPRFPKVRSLAAVQASLHVVLPVRPAV